MRFGLFLTAALLVAGSVPDTPDEGLVLDRQEVEPPEVPDFELELSLAPFDPLDDDGHPLPDDEPAPLLPLLPAPRPWQPRTA
jgi:hypothetical protein